MPPFAQAIKPLAAAALLALALPAVAATTVYTTSASFLAQVAAGAYTEGFSVGQAGSPPILNYSGAGFSYTATSPGGNVYAPGDNAVAGTDGFVGTSSPNTVLVLTFTGGSPTAVGGEFFNTDYFDSFVASAVKLTLSDGSTRLYTPASQAGTYTGFISTLPIMSLTFSAPGPDLYAALDNLTVGRSAVAVPEASTYAMLLAGLGVVGLMAGRRRA
jgi:PEP-CTERM motif